MYNISDSVSIPQSGNNSNNSNNKYSAPKVKEPWSKPSGESGSSRKNFKERTKKFNEND